MGNIVTDADGNTTFYGDDGSKRLVLYKDGCKLSYKDGVPLLFDGSMGKMFFGDDGITPSAFVDRDNNTTFYREDGATPEAFADKNGNTVYFENDGITVGAIEYKNKTQVLFKNENVDASSDDKLLTLKDSNGNEILRAYEVEKVVFRDDKYAPASDREVVAQAQMILDSYSKHKEVLSTFRENLAKYNIDVSAHQSGYEGVSQALKTEETKHRLGMNDSVPQPAAQQQFADRVDDHAQTKTSTNARTDVQIQKPINTR